MLRFLQYYRGHPILGTYDAKTGDIGPPYFVRVRGRTLSAGDLAGLFQLVDRRLEADAEPELEADMDPEAPSPRTVRRDDDDPSP